jgi:hypothetical protein
MARADPPRPARAPLCRDLGPVTPSAPEGENALCGGLGPPRGWVTPDAPRGAIALRELLRAVTPCSPDCQLCYLPGQQGAEI